VSGRPAEGEYARFLEATLDLAQASTSLPRRAKFGMAVAILRVCESDREARTAYLGGDERRMAQAAIGLRTARASLAAAACETTMDLRRRRSLSLVA
jgi:hypothetical protein